MIDAGEPEENIATVIRGFPKGPQPIAASEPETYAGGFAKSLGETARQTAAGIGQGALAAINPLNLVRGPYELAKDVIAHHGAGTLANLQQIAQGNPAGGGQAIGGLLV